jgi:hypothetical protein
VSMNITNKVATNIRLKGPAKIAFKGEVFIS